VMLLIVCKHAKPDNAPEGQSVIDADTVYSEIKRNTIQSAKSPPVFLPFQAYQSTNKPTHDNQVFCSFRASQCCSNPENLAVRNTRRTLVQTIQARRSYTVSPTSSALELNTVARDRMLMGRVEQPSTARLRTDDGLGLSSESFCNVQTSQLPA